MPLYCQFYWLRAYLNLYEVAIFSPGMAKFAKNNRSKTGEVHVLPDTFRRGNRESWVTWYTGAHLLHSLPWEIAGAGVDLLTDL